MLIYRLLQEPPDGPPLETMLCLLGVSAVVAMIMLASAIRIVPEYRRLVIFRLGRYLGVQGPGVLILLPIVDRGIEVDLREQVKKLEEYGVPTRDGPRLLVDLLWSYKITDPAKSLLEVANFEQAAGEALASVLEATFGSLDLADALRDRDGIRAQIQERITEVMAPWGAQVTNLELRNLTREY